MQKLPIVNKELALKLINDEVERDKISKSKHAISLLKDDRFKALFENSAFQIEKDSEDYK